MCDVLAIRPEEALWPDAKLFEHAAQQIAEKTESTFFMMLATREQARLVRFAAGSGPLDLCNIRQENLRVILAVNRYQSRKETVDQTCERLAATKIRPLPVFMPSVLQRLKAAPQTWIVHFGFCAKCAYITAWRLTCADTDATGRGLFRCYCEACDRKHA